MQKLNDFIQPPSPIKKHRQNQLIESLQQNHLGASQYSYSLTQNSVDLLEKIRIDSLYYIHFQRLEKIEEQNQIYKAGLQKLRQEFEQLKQIHLSNQFDINDIIGI
ncbi:hypothetical protein SS50377_26363 [Spironucleus salmonicida]|uniref:Uncharacterized protein n=1 Tax=Spironucleus salmonicida TaxID=348837 RepID=V6LT67_9EUKA|nr:hypothetical protein SS50377_26363 [Spironucleus salmonicida]|eukprot:EST47770.1 Hypothetical protein SS50377_12169 [Spironucleus salmonicida]